MTVSVGCAGIPQGLRRSRYFERLRYLEVAATFQEPPKLAVVRKWTEDLPVGARFGVVAWQLITHTAGRRGHVGLRSATTTLSPEQLARAGHFHDAPVVRDAWARTAAVADALDAEVIVFRTPADFTPSAANRDAMRRFFTDDAVAPWRARAALVWEAEGLWTTAAMRQVADELDLVVATDPLGDDPTGADADLAPQPRGYFRVRALGSGRRRLDDGRLELLADRCAERERSWVVFATPDAYRDAQRFDAWMRGGTAT